MRAVSCAHSPTVTSSSATSTSSLKSTRHRRGFVDVRRRTTASATRGDDGRRNRRRHAKRELASPYDVLGLPRDATPTEVKVAFRKTAKATHPDAGGAASTDDPGAAFRRCVAAYEVLTTPTRRAKIDRGYVDDDGDEFAWIDDARRTSIRRYPAEYECDVGEPTVSASSASTSSSSKRRGDRVRAKSVAAAPCAEAWEEKVAPVPENREDLLFAHRLRQFIDAWTRWCELWFAFLSFVAPAGFAYAAVVRIVAMVTLSSDVDGF